MLVFSACAEGGGGGESEELFRSARSQPYRIVCGMYSQTAGEEGVSHTGSGEIGDAGAGGVV